MKQLIQNLNSGIPILLDAPVPKVADGHLLIQTQYSLISSGTERMLLEFGKANWIQKALQKPEQVNQVIQKIKTDGFSATYETIKSKINKPILSGYSNVGTVIAIGNGVKGFQIGDLVISNGSHAEFVHVPSNLCAKVPENVSPTDAVFTVVVSIALQGIRITNPTFGETIVVYGLGLIGLLTVQLLKANGCHVIGIDYDKERCLLAESYGALICNSSNDDNISASIINLNHGEEVDGVILTLSSKDKAIISHAAHMCRKNGSITLVGDTPLQLNRADFYKKQLSFRVSCSYGEGRYQHDYEKNGNDLPVEYVRWTVQRNFKAVLNAIAHQQLDFSKLKPEIFDIEEYATVYDPAFIKKHLALLFRYNTNALPTNVIEFSKTLSKKTTSGNQIGIVGAGNFISKIVLPYLSKFSNFPIKHISSINGINAAQLAKTYHIAFASSDAENILNDPEISLVCIALEHHLHAPFVLKMLNAGKKVYVEKPLAIQLDVLKEIIALSTRQQILLHVGYNRRFAPIALQVKELLQKQPFTCSIHVNAGTLLQEHWLSDRNKSGGRIIGEVGHFVDLLLFWNSALVTNVVAAQYADETTLITLQFANGNLAMIHYHSKGNPLLSKETIELHYAGKSILINNWKQVTCYGVKTIPSKSQDKGHQHMLERVIYDFHVQQKNIIPLVEIFNVSCTTFAIEKSIQQKKWINVDSILEQTTTEE